MSELFELSPNFDYKKEVAKLLKKIYKQRARIDTAECYHDEYAIAYDATNKLKKLNVEYNQIKAKFYDSLPQNYSDDLKLKKWLEITGDYQ
jgi:RNase H-fold protein (predicted Holliday junction resolvase)